MAHPSTLQRIKLLWITVVAALGGLLFGYDTGVISAAILFIREEFVISIFQQGLLISTVALGAMLGALTGGPLADRIGRKKVILLSCIVFIISSLALAKANSVELLIIGRLLVGVAIGITSSTVPLYIAEMAPLSLRGALVTVNQLAITIGILLAYVIGYLFAFSHGWRWMFGLGAVPAFVQFCILIFFPESPRWLVFHHNKEKALEVLKKYRSTSQEAIEEVEHITKTSLLKSGSWKSLFAPTMLPALLAGIGVTVIQQVTGINTIIYFAPTIFQFAGFQSAQSAIFATIFVGVINVLMTCVAIYLLDRVGRKPLLLAGLGGMIISLFILGLGFLFPQASTRLGWIAVLSLLGYIACFAFSLGPISWLLNSEIYPLRIRGRAVGLATCANWISNFFVTLTFLNLIQLLGASGTFWLYACIGMLGLYFIVKKVPETKNKSLEEIEAFWENHRDPTAMK